MAKAVGAGAVLAAVYSATGRQAGVLGLTLKGLTLNRRSPSSDDKAVTTTLASTPAAAVVLCIWLCR